MILANNLGLLCQSYRSSADPTVLFAWLSALGFFLHHVQGSAENSTDSKKAMPLAQSASLTSKGIPLT